MAVLEKGLLRTLRWLGRMETQHLVARRVLLRACAVSRFAFVVHQCTARRKPLPSVSLVCG